MNFIWIKNKKYYFYDRCSTYIDAIQIAKKLSRKNKRNKYFIIKKEIGYIAPYYVYDLYTTKFAKI